MSVKNNMTLEEAKEYFKNNIFNSTKTSNTTIENLGYVTLLHPKTIDGDGSERQFKENEADEAFDILIRNINKNKI